MTRLKSFVAPIGALLLTAAIQLHAGDIATVALDVRGMDCASCPLTVKQVLKKLPGVSEVSVDYPSHSAQVKFDPDKTRPSQLAKAVTDIGYPTTVKK